jgi:hypothetical protein
MADVVLKRIVALFVKDIESGIVQIEGSVERHTILLIGHRTCSRASEERLIIVSLRA